MSKKFAWKISITSAILLVAASYSAYGVRASVSLARAGSSCPYERPIQVTVRNWTFSSVSGSSVDLYAYRADKERQNILSISSHYLFKPVKAFSTGTECFADKAFSPTPPDIKIELDPPKIVVHDYVPLDDELKRKRERASLIDAIARKSRKRKELLAMLTNPQASEEKKAEASLDLIDLESEQTGMYPVKPQTTPLPQVEPEPEHAQDSMGSMMREYDEIKEKLDGVTIEIVHFDYST